MPEKNTIDIKSLSKELESLIDIVGDSCGPLLIKELQGRMDRTIDVFNKDVKKMLEFSFKSHNNKLNKCKEILNSKEMVDDNKTEKKEIISPQFIQSYKKKKRNKL